MVIEFKNKIQELESQVGNLQEAETKQKEIILELMAEVKGLTTNLRELDRPMVDGSTQTDRKSILNTSSQTVRAPEAQPKASKPSLSNSMSIIQPGIQNLEEDSMEASKGKNKKRDPNAEYFQMCLLSFKLNNQDMEEVMLLDHRRLYKKCVDEDKTEFNMFQDWIQKEVQRISSMLR